MTQLRAEILVGQRYRFLNRIASDQATETWKVFDTRLGRPLVLQLLSEHERGNVRAQADVRARARGRTLPAAPGDVNAPRVLDGGEDPIYGPFVVAEVGSSDVTRPLPTLDPSAAASVPGDFRLSPERGMLGLFVLVGAVLMILAGFVFAARVLGPSDQATTPATVGVTPPQPNRPSSGAPVTPNPAVTSEPQPAPAPKQATSGPTSPPAAQPTAQTAPRLSAQPTPSAAAQAQPTQGSPAETIRQHYAFIDARRYAEGYALMDAHLRSLNSSADYESWFVNKISVKPISVDVTSQTATEAVVHAVVDTTDRVDGQSVTRRVSEEFVLHPENGAWRIDQVSSL